MLNIDNTIVLDKVLISVEKLSSLMFTMMQWNEDKFSYSTTQSIYLVYELELLFVYFSLHLGYCDPLNSYYIILF